MSVWKKTMLYLGLGPDDEYESAPPPTGMHPDPTMAPPGELRAAPMEYDTGSTAGGVRPLGPVDAPAEPVAVGAGSRPLATIEGASSSRLNTVRPIPASSSTASKPHLLSPRTFNDAQEIADRFRGGKPVIVNLQEVDRELSRRLIDFASGLCYGLHGKMEKVADRVYLLVPDDVEVAPEHRIELREKGLHDG